ncbi:hypothetical protein BDB01DRAFT_802516 [Pilobolus umbonatus]|nr:hypothetical protein BDB01DRAFT_802516 [Pilobolus umbonatus]
MGTTKSRKSRRNNSRPTAFTFLSNISLGNENDKLSDTSIVNPYISDQNIHYVEDNSVVVGVSSLHSTDSSFSAEEDNVQTTLPSYSRGNSNPIASASVITTTEQRKGKLTIKRNSSHSQESIHHHKLTREDSERPIASEKIKKRSTQGDNQNGQNGSILSVFRYYTDKIRQSGKRKHENKNRGYVQQLESQDSHRHRKAQSYAHFLNTTGSLLEDNKDEVYADEYDPYFLDDDTYGIYGLDSGSLGTLANGMKPSDLKREMNEQFRLNHPEIPQEITLSKIRAIKLHLLEIAKEVDLEVSSVAHAYVYFERLVIKNLITKKNRKLIAGCCLFLATKVNEAKGTWFKPLLDTIDNELGIDPEEIHEHEFAVFADLEFNLYVPRCQFMAHFERIFNYLEYKSMQEYLGNSTFYEVNQRM